MMAYSSAFMSIRAYVMGVGGIYLFYVLKKNKITWQQLGITTNNFFASTKELIIPSLTILITAYLIFLAVPPKLVPTLVGVDPQSINSLPLRLLLYSLWSVPFQELLFRSYLYVFASSAYTSSKTIALIMWLIFVLAHVPFFSPMMMLVAMWMGYLYVQNYLKYFNILPIMLSHALVGSILIVLRNFYLPY